MATWSPNLKITLIGDGEQSGTWGATTNTNLQDVLEQAISNYATVTVADSAGSPTTLTMPDGASGTARNAYIEFIGTLTAARAVETVANKKIYYVYNNTTGGYAVTLKVTGQTGISIPYGKKMILVSNGTDIVEAAGYFASFSAGSINSTPIGAGTPSTGAFTTLSASGAVSGTGFTNLFASPPAIGGTSPAAITGTIISANTGFVGSLNGTVGDVSPASGAFTTLSASSTVTGTGFANLLTNAFASPTAIGSTAPNTGAFSTLTLTNPLGLTYGGTGASTQAGAANAILPSQSTNAGKYLTTDGANASWATVTSGTVTSVSASTTSAPFLSASVTNASTTPAISLSYSGTALPIANGGTGGTTASAGINNLMPSQATQAGKFLSTNGTDLFWTNVSGAAGGTVTSVSTDTVSAPFMSATVTNSTSTPLITFAYTGTALPAANGGTGNTTYAIGDILYASGATALSKLAAAATGNALISGGAATAPSWGKVGLTTHVSGTLPVANGGTGATTLTGILKGNGTGAFTAATAGTDYLTPSGSGASLTSLNAGNISTGTLVVARGGTGTGTAPTSGQLLIGNSGGTYTVASLTAGTGVTITPGSGSITIASTASGGTVTSVGIISSLSGISATGGPITSSGSITLSGVLDIANGGTGANTASGARTNLGLAIGTNVQAYSANLGAIAGLAVTDSNFIVGNGTTWVAETGATARTSLGATTVGSNFFTLTNPSAITFPRINADNTVSALDAATFRTAIGAGTSSTTGTVTSVGGTGTVSGLSLSGTVTTSGNLTLSGTLSVTGSNFGSQTANYVLAAPNGTAGTPTFRALVAADIPTLNQNTTGTAAGLSSTLVVSSGGTGATTLTGYVKGNGTSAFTAASTIPGSDITGNIAGNAAGLTATLGVASGGTGQTSYTDGQLLIGNSTGNTLTKATLTAGSGISITNGAGSITITSTAGGTGTVTSVGVSGGTTGLTTSGGPITTSGTITLAGTLGVANGGTGATTLTGILKGNGTSAVTAATAGTDYVLPSGNITGTASNVTGVVAAANGGTGQSSYTIGDILYASTASALSKLTAVATGNALISGGAGAAPSWGKIGLTTHVIDTLPAANGGTGQSSYTLGDILYASGSTAVSKLAGNTTATKQFLSQTGTGTVSAAPAWSAVTKSDVGLGNVENTALSTWAGSANITTLGTVATGTWSATTIAVNKGGTGQTTYTDGQLLIGNSTGNTLAKATLTQGTGITITNGAGSITVANAGVTSFSAGTTGLTPSTGTTGAVTLAGTLGVANGGTGATTLTGIVKGNGTGAFTAVTAPSGAIVGTTDTQTLSNKTIDANSSISDTGTIAATSPGFRGVPQNAKTANYTLALTDAGKHISITTGGVVIPANASVAFPIGTTIVVYNDSATSQNITITTDTLRLAGTATTGTRALAGYGVATLMKVASTTWACMGAGVT